MVSQPTPAEAAEIILDILRGLAPVGEVRGLGAVKYPYDVHVGGAEGFVEGLKEGEKRGWFALLNGNVIVRKV